jgi:hypothetical protein
LVQAVDIFAGDDPEVVDCARRIASETSAAGEAMALEQALELARQVVESRRASVDYRLVQRDPFAMVDLDLDTVRRHASDGGPATGDQRAWLQKAGVPVARIAQLSGRQAYELREALLDRKAVGMCTLKQAWKLVDFGIDPRQVVFEQAQELLRIIQRGKDQKSVEAIRSECLAGGARFF